MGKTDEKNKSYVMGIVGALVGGTIATLPWILCYVYANMMWSIFAIFIAMGAVKGYELLKGKIDKKLPIIITVVSLVCITIATLFIIPQLLLLKEYGTTNMEMFKVLYSIDTFKKAIMHDYIFSLLFTVLGISGVVSSIKRCIEAGDEKLSFNKPVFAPSEEDIAKVRAIFEEKNAFDKNSCIPKDEVKEKIKGQEGVFNFLKARGLVKSTKDGFYYKAK